MALDSTITWEVRTTGDDDNGGGYKPGSTGTDFSQQNAPQYALTGIASSGAGDTVLSALAADDMVGNIAQTISGTNFNSGFYEILSVSVGVSITFSTNNASASICSGVGASGVINIGGALASPAIAAAAKSAGNDVFIKAGTYSVTTASTNVANGCVDDNTGGTGSTNTSNWVGYNTNRFWGNSDTPPLLQASGAISGFTIFLISGVAAEAYNIATDCAAKATSKGFETTSNYDRLISCVVKNATSVGLRVGSGNSCHAINCEITGCSGTAGIYVSSSSLAWGCVSHDNTCSGFVTEPNASTQRSLAYGNSGSSSDGYECLSVGHFFAGCVAYGNGRWGFNLTNNIPLGCPLINCIAESNDDVGFKTDGVADGVYLINCAGFDNGTGNYDPAQIQFVLDFKVGSSTFFTNAAAGDFSLNNVAGADLRAAGFPSVLPGGLTPNYIDIGVVQHQDTGGGGSSFIPNVFE